MSPRKHYWLMKTEPDGFSIDDLRTMANEGEALPLVDGSGMVYGNFVITALDVRHTALMADGTPRRIDFGLDLLRGDDGPGSAT